MSELAARDNWNLHWERYAASTEINPAQIYRHRLIFEALRGSYQPCLVDVGSGQGDLIQRIANWFPEGKFLGLELSETGVRIAQGKNPRAQFLQRDMLAEAPVPEAFRNWGTDAVCSEVLEHVDEPEKILRNLQAFLIPGARILVTVPAGPRTAFDKHIGHRRHYTRRTLRELAERSGLRVERIDAAGFPFMNLYKLVVLLRGKKVIEDVALSEHAEASGLARFVMGVFRLLFLGNLRSSPFGWQLVGVFRKP